MSTRRNSRRLSDLLPKRRKSSSAKTDATDHPELLLGVSPWPLDGDVYEKGTYGSTDEDKAVLAECKARRTNLAASQACDTRTKLEFAEAYLPCAREQINDDVRGQVVWSSWMSGMVVKKDKLQCFTLLGKHAKHAPMGEYMMSTLLHVLMKVQDAFELGRFPRGAKAAYSMMVHAANALSAMTEQTDFVAALQQFPEGKPPELHEEGLMAMKHLVLAEVFRLYLEWEAAVKEYPSTADRADATADKQLLRVIVSEAAHVHMTRCDEYLQALTKSKAKQRLTLHPKLRRFVVLRLFTTRLALLTSLRDWAERVGLEIVGGDQETGKDYLIALGISGMISKLELPVSCTPAADGVEELYQHYHTMASTQIDEAKQTHQTMLKHAESLEAKPITCTEELIKQYLYGKPGYPDDTHPPYAKRTPGSTTPEWCPDKEKHRELLKNMVRTSSQDAKMAFVPPVSLRASHWDRSSRWERSSEPTALRNTQPEPATGDAGAGVGLTEPPSVAAAAQASLDKFIKELSTQSVCTAAIELDVSSELEEDLVTASAADEARTAGAQSTPPAAPLDTMAPRVGERVLLPAAPPPSGRSSIDEDAKPDAAQDAKPEADGAEPPYGGEASNDGTGDGSGEADGGDDASSGDDDEDASEVDEPTSEGEGEETVSFEDEDTGSVPQTSGLAPAAAADTPGHDAANSVYHSLSKPAAAPPKPARTVRFEDVPPAAPTFHRPLVNVWTCEAILVMGNQTTGETANMLCKHLNRAGASTCSRCYAPQPGVWACNVCESNNLPQDPMCKMTRGCNGERDKAIRKKVWNVEKEAYEWNIPKDLSKDEAFARALERDPTSRPHRPAQHCSDRSSGAGSSSGAGPSAANVVGLSEEEQMRLALELSRQEDAGGKHSQGPSASSAAEPSSPAQRAG